MAAGRFRRNTDIGQCFGQRYRGGYLVGPEVEPDVITYDGAHDWTGFYAGVHAGFGLLDTQDSLGLGEENIRTPLTGVHAGFNYQLGSFVFGLEADATAL